MSDFKIIKGGLPDHPEHEFIDAAVTDTRLMGVLGLRVHWLVSSTDSFDTDGTKDVYHFYYFDVEELGLDFLKIYEMSDPESVNLATASCFGGLGAKMRVINENEAMHLIKYFIEDTIKKGEDLPESVSDMLFLLDNCKPLSDAELEALNAAMCTDIKTDFGVVNYYLMRMFGKDFEGAELLKDLYAPDENFNDISMPHHASFLRNAIQTFDEERGKAYLCESLVESDDTHYVVTSEVRVCDKKVVYAKKKSSFAISITETSLILARREYCNVYRITASPEDFDADFAEISIGTTRTEHETGDMYMEFNADNDHVESDDFRLYNDLNALYYVTDFGELIVAAYNLKNILDAEKKIMNSPVAEDIVITKRMQFVRAVLYEFSQSGFTSFTDFIESLQ